MKKTIKNVAAFLTICVLLFSLVAVLTFATDTSEISSAEAESASEQGDTAEGENEGTAESTGEGETTNETEIESETDFSYLGGAFSSERWIYSGEMVGVGMLMVFAVLAILWIIFSITGKIFNRDKQNDDGKESVTSTPEIPAAPPAPSAPVVTQGAVTDAELAAVITAAIAAMIETGDYPELKSGFRVVSFKRSNSRGMKNR